MPSNPIPPTHVSNITKQRDVEKAALRDGLAAMYNDLINAADAIHKHAASLDPSPSIEMEDGLSTVIFVTTPT